MIRTFDPEAARAELRGRVAANDAALAKIRERLGALALDVALGNAAQSELDAATSEQATAQVGATPVVVGQDFGCVAHAVASFRWGVVTTER